MNGLVTMASPTSSICISVDSSDMLCDAELTTASLSIGAGNPNITFVFIWDKDVVDCLHKGILEDARGIYNLVGDGTLTVKQIAGRLGKPYVPLPASILKTALWFLGKMGMTRYGPEQVGFLQYRPVLSNRRLKEEFGFVPQKSTQETFDYYLQKQGIR